MVSELKDITDMCFKFSNIIYISDKIDPSEHLKKFVPFLDIKKYVFIFYRYCPSVYKYDFSLLLHIELNSSCYS